MEVKEIVKEKYGEAARRVIEGKGPASGLLFANLLPAKLSAAGFAVAINADQSH